MSSSVSWAQTVDWQALAMLAQAIAIAIGAWWARSSIRKLVSERSVTRRLELAENALRIAYRIQDRVRSYRLFNPAPNWMSGIDINVDEDPIVVEIRNINNEFVPKIDQISPDLTIYFGPEVSDSLRSLKLPLMKLYWAATSIASYRWLLRTQGQPAAGEKPVEDQKTISGEPEDDFDQEITSVIERMTAEIGKYDVRLRK